MSRGGVGVCHGWAERGRPVYRDAETARETARETDRCGVRDLTSEEKDAALAAARGVRRLGAPDPGLERLLSDVASVKHLSFRWPWSDLTTLANEVLALRREVARLTGGEDASVSEAGDRHGLGGAE